MQIAFVTGSAGTGKTTWLSKQISTHATVLLRTPHQRILAITRMHGSRRRVESKLREVCPGIPFVVSTIDGIALSIVNRWRMSLGYSKVLHGKQGANFEESEFGIDADFEKIAELAIRLFQSATVREWWNGSFPLVVVDEFQDCRGALLTFVQNLSSCSKTLLAGDDFQDLYGADGTDNRCPAVDWVHTMKINGKADIHTLSLPQRFSGRILAAADALRSGVEPEGTTVPVFLCPQAGPAAWKIIDSLVLSSQRWKGSTALLSCKTDGFLKTILQSCDKQLIKRQLEPIRWRYEASGDGETKELCKSLGLLEDSFHVDWKSPDRELGSHEQVILDRARRYARLRGLRITNKLVERFVRLAVHDRRAYGNADSSRVVTTILGAKNREFENVIVVWTFELPDDPIKQRRLLYNAVTRSKKNCMVLIIGGSDRITQDGALRLLGPARPAFPPKPKAKKKT